MMALIRFTFVAIAVMLYFDFLDDRDRYNRIRDLERKVKDIEDHLVL